MNASPQAGPLSASTPNRRRNRIVRTMAALVLLMVAAVVSYSTYVATHEPDAQETVILGQTRIASGSPAGLRVLVRNRATGKPIAGAGVELTLTGRDTGPARLGVFKTGSDGSLADPVEIPELPPGNYQLMVNTASLLGEDRIVAKVEIQSHTRILLSSDKPIYQPGQTIHVRTLVLNDRTGKPSAESPIIFEISDPKGNKIFKESRKTSAYGIASADFVLASELNLGRYQVRALAGTVEAERDIEVKNYVLPKFKIQISTDHSFYRPGGTVSGSVAASYIFGKPVSGASVRLTASIFHENPVVLTELRGTTDALGRYTFQFTLPDSFAALAQADEPAGLNLTAEVCDPAGHNEEKTLPLIVTESELEVTAIPEAGALVPGVENVVYVLTAYPDGRPAACKVAVNGATYQTDDQGVGQFKVTPGESDQQFAINAVDSAGRKGSEMYRADTNRPTPAFLLRADKAVYELGQTARLTLLSGGGDDIVFIDVIKDGETVLTKSVPLANHLAEYDLGLPASLVGELKLNAYELTDAGAERKCSRVIYVNPASGLHISAQPSKAVYRPGETARLDLSVTDAAGRPAPAALGIAIVDESVFALGENRPSLPGQFLDVDGDQLKPRYQIKAFDSPAQLFKTGNQSLAAAYFASLEAPRIGPNLDDLVRQGYIPQKLVDQARELRGSPANAQLGADPQYAAAMRLLDGTQGDYSLREATGIVKVQALEARRKAYFDRLEGCILAVFLGLLFILPIGLLIHYSRPEGEINSGALAEVQADRYAGMALTLHWILQILTVTPLICYPVGFILISELFHAENSGWPLLVLEMFAVIVSLGVQFRRMAVVEAGNLKSEVATLRVFLGVFLIQFIASRAGFVLMCLRGSDDVAAPWFLASLIAPLIVIGSLGAHIRRQFSVLGMRAKVPGVRFLELLVVITITLVLAGLLLPALAKSKAKALRISLLSDLKQIDIASQIAEKDGVDSGGGGSPSPRVRRDFPETLLWRPELITDDQGRATLDIPLADSITTWRASIDGISRAGKLGDREVPITVFQDFFVDLDLPVSMSLDDEVSVPVTGYNYLKEPQDIRFELSAGDWFQSPARELTLHLGPNEVKSVSFPVKVSRVGKHSLRMTVRGTKMSDAVEREINVLPTGERFDYTRNDALKSAFADTFTLPAEAIPGSQKLQVRFYPSRFSEVVGGLDAVFQAPYGCFEQASSTTYPNVLVLDYLRRMAKLTPEIELKARKYINDGHQRLLTFELPGGGFEWFGRDPANVCLTAYGILEFTDMARVHPVDATVIERSRKWLFAQQNITGSWSETHRGETWEGPGSMTSFIAWALAESGDQSPNLDRALNYLRTHPRELFNTYARALAANAFLARDRNDSFGRELAGGLKEAALKDAAGGLHWTSTGYSITYSHDSGMETECTALCVMALMKAGDSPQSVKQGLTWISRRKFADGTHGSTQATILAMRALLAGASTSLGQDFESAVTVSVNGRDTETFRINKNNSDVMRQIDLKGALRPGANTIQLRQSPAGELPFQLSGAYWLPRPAMSNLASSAPEPLEITTEYDRTTLPVNAELHCKVTAKNHAAQTVNMPIVDLGIPPGFSVDPTAFETILRDGRIEKFELTGSQIILYLRALSRETPFQFNYALRAKYPLRVQAPASAIYEYYQPQNRARSKMVALSVTGD